MPFLIRTHRFLTNEIRYNYYSTLIVIKLSTRIIRNQLKITAEGRILTADELATVQTYGDENGASRFHIKGENTSLGYCNIFY
jgi:hypothetical protein